MSCGEREKKNQSSGKSEKDIKPIGQAISIKTKSSSLGS